MSSTPSTPPPPIRATPTTADPQFDGDRLDWGWKFWNSQTDALRLRDRSIEEHVRMLCGQQNLVWNSMQNRFVDVSHWMTDEERRWRQRPTFNRLLRWFLQTHARLVENPPILTFVPGPDQMDAELAETMDTVFKAVWRDIGMLDVNDRLMMWMIVAGQAHIISRVDLDRGPIRQWTGTAQLPVLQGGMTPLFDHYGQPVMETHDNVPFDQEGGALAYIDAQTGQMVPIGDAHFDREGELVCDVLSPLQVRGQWGDRPWQLKDWHGYVDYFTPEECKSKWGVDVDADDGGIQGNGAGELQRVMFGAGYYGAASGKLGADFGAPRPTSDRFVEVLTLYHKPGQYPTAPQMAETPESPGGRMMVMSRKKMFCDQVRPARWRYTSPIRSWDFIRLPGRPSGSTPLEILCAPQRAYNRRWASILEQTQLQAHPITIVDSGSGLDETEITNAPGQKYTVTRRPGVAAIEFVAPPALGADTYKALEMLGNEIEEAGNLQGTEGAPPSTDASGELVKELRFNSDRYIGPTARRAVEEYGRLAEDWMVMLPILWDQPKIIAYAGEDNVAQTLTVMPDLLRGGKINVMPDVESMLPEGRGERQQRVHQMYMEGMFGPPGSPDAVKQYLQYANFPNLSRVSRPGGPHRVMAEHILGRLVQGDASSVQQWLPWYNPMVHMQVLTDFIAGPAFERCTPVSQHLLNARWQFINMVLQGFVPPNPLDGSQSTAVLPWGYGQQAPSTTGPQTDAASAAPLPGTSAPIVGGPMESPRPGMFAAPASLHLPSGTSAGNEWPGGPTFNRPTPEAMLSPVEPVQ